MNNKITPSKLDTKDFKVIGTKGSLNSVGKDIVYEAGKVVTPIVLEAFKGKIELDQETQRLVRDDKRNILNKRADALTELIVKEEVKADYNQERIKKWEEDLEEVMRKLDTMNSKAEGFTKRLLFTLKNLSSINSNKRIDE